MRTALLAALALALPGCVYVEQPAWQPLAYAPPVGPNAGAGAAVGALAGGLIGAAAAGSHDRGLGIAGGAAAGALLGGLVGSGIDRDHAAAASTYTQPYPPPVYDAPKSWPEAAPPYPVY